MCAAANTNLTLLAIRESVAQDGTPCTNPDSSIGICAAGICTVRLYNCTTTIVTFDVTYIACRMRQCVELGS